MLAPVNGLQSNMPTKPSKLPKYICQGPLISNPIEAQMLQMSERVESTSSKKAPSSALHYTDYFNNFNNNNHNQNQRMEKLNNLKMRKQWRQDFLHNHHDP